ncbi:MAG: hypothetical protein M0P71_12135 [Melioribacteraceae bacterium]|nr:hypothetical protein [Melioribacteraceae bacterium]
MDSSFVINNSLREKIDLNKNWSVYYSNNKEEAKKINMPASFTGSNKLTYERYFVLSQNQIENKSVQIIFEGLSYSAEISLNGKNIYNYYGGGIPFSINLPKENLFYNKSNLLKVIVTKTLDSENSIPLKPRFLFPAQNGGIIRNVYLSILPNVYIDGYSFKKTISPKTQTGTLDIDVTVINSLPVKKTVNQDSTNNYYAVNVIISSKNGSQVFRGESKINAIPNSRSKTIKIKVPLTGIALWSPESPNIYSLKMELIRDGDPIDLEQSSVSFYQFTTNGAELSLNENKFVIKGTTYISYNTYTGTKDISNIKYELILLKEAGFNTVRFYKHFPNPNALKICEEIGLLAFIEIPINSVPEELLLNQQFSERYENSLSNFAKEYSIYSSVAAIGLGSSFLLDSDINRNFISKFAQVINNKTDKISYASFLGYSDKNIYGLGLYGFELNANRTTNTENFINLISNKDKVNFVSEVSYPNYYDKSSGYLSAYSAEAQSKFFADFIPNTLNKNNSGLIINSVFGFRGDFISSYGGNSDWGFYRIKILDNVLLDNSLAFRTIKGSLTNTNTPNISIGADKGDSPISFIITPIIITLLLTIVVNAKRKIREDFSRALLKSYNFFADVRDNRIYTGIASLFVLLFSLASAATLFAILLFYFKDNIFVEKLIISSGLGGLTNTILSLTWDTTSSFIALFILALIKTGILILIIKGFSLLVKTKVGIQKIFYVVSWSLLPLTLLLPLELVLYKILEIGLANTAIFAFISLWFIWVLFRIIKGTYIIFDISAIKVYSYSFGIIIGLIVISVLYLHFSNQSVYYIINVIKQIQLMNY